jgi:hypothetical protein
MPPSEFAATICFPKTATVFSLFTVPCWKGNTFIGRYSSYEVKEAQYLLSGLEDDGAVDRGLREDKIAAEKGRPVAVLKHLQVSES